MAMEIDAKLYIVTRSDLRNGLKIAQCCHAMREFTHAHPEIDREWFDVSKYIVVLTVDDERSLREKFEEIRAQGIKVAEFCEPDLDNAMTAFACEPSSRTRSSLKSLRLAN